jgi:hypothetical protein
MIGGIVNDLLNPIFGLGCRLPFHVRRFNHTTPLKRHDVIDDVTRHGPYVAPAPQAERPTSLGGDYDCFRGHECTHRLLP